MEDMADLKTQFIVTMNQDNLDCAIIAHLQICEIFITYDLFCQFTIFKFDIFLGVHNIFTSSPLYTRAAIES